MKYHVLPGDALVGKFREAAIDGEIIVCRECLTDGETRAETLEEFWNVRAALSNRLTAEAIIVRKSLPNLKSC